MTKTNSLFEECLKNITPEMKKEIDAQLDSGQSPLVDVSQSRKETVCEPAV